MTRQEVIDKLWTMGLELKEEWDWAKYDSMYDIADDWNESHPDEEIEFNGYTDLTDGNTDVSGVVIDDYCIDFGEDEETDTSYIVMCGGEVKGTDETFEGEYTGIVYSTRKDAMQELEDARSEYDWAYIKEIES